MAIVQETYEMNGRQFVRTWSDAGRYVVGGVPQRQYAEANDPAELGRVYTEGEPIEEMSAEEQALTRYSNELTGASDITLTEATETLIKIIKENK
jgi:hypothetical protein